MEYWDFLLLLEVCIAIYFIAHYLKHKEIAQKIVDANAPQVEAYRGGKTQLFGFFVGQVMKETKGRANPQTVNSLLKEILG